MDTYKKLIVYNLVNTRFKECFYLSYNESRAKRIIFQDANLMCMYVHTHTCIHTYKHIYVYIYLDFIIQKSIQFKEGKLWTITRK
jgi:hypothetical protein